MPPLRPHSRHSIEPALIAHSSAISYRLSAIGYRLSAIGYRLSAIALLLPRPRRSLLRRGAARPAGAHIADHAGRVAHDNRIIGHIARHDGAGPDKRPAPDRHARHDDRPGADSRAIADPR